MKRVDNKIKTSKILDYDHWRWDEFANAMIEKVIDCDSTHKITRAVLSRMKYINIDGTLEFFESLSGYCDCRVIYFVVRPYMETKGWEGRSKVVPCYKVFNGIVNALLKPDDINTDGELSH